MYPVPNDLVQDFPFLIEKLVQNKLRLYHFVLEKKVEI